jgi:hypothetical protein
VAGRARGRLRRDLADLRQGPGPRLSYDDIVEEALCFGWIDSQPRTLDETRAMLYVAPRKPRSS